MLERAERRCFMLHDVTPTTVYNLATQMSKEFVAGLEDVDRKSYPQPPANNRERFERDRAEADCIYQLENAEYDRLIDDYKTRGSFSELSMRARSLNIKL